MKMIKAGIIGGAGYTGGELLRLLLLHPAVEIAFVQSSSNSNKPVSNVHTDLTGETNLLFSETHHTDIDVLFLCMIVILYNLFLFHQHPSRDNTGDRHSKYKANRPH